ENTGPHDAETGAAASRWASAKYSVGSTTSTSSVAEISPPMMTTASGFCVSEPMPCESAIGSSPSIASSAVISTVRIRISAPRSTASAGEVTGHREGGVRRADPHQQLECEARGVHLGIGAQQVGRGAGVLKLRLGHFALGDVARPQPHRVGLQQLPEDLAPIAGECALPLGQQEVEERLPH